MMTPDNPFSAIPSILAGEEERVGGEEERGVSRLEREESGWGKRKEWLGDRGLENDALREPQLQ